MIPLTDSGVDELLEGFTGTNFRGSVLCLRWLKYD